ncbi:MAG: DUF3808 domain-containing protein [Thiomargarita sp.]|nr:DUF3808 domain-containing protein [Thiomargarita sp.]
MMKIKYYKYLEIILIVNFFTACTATPTEIQKDITIKSTSTDASSNIVIEPVLNKNYFLSARQEYMYKFLVAELNLLRGNYKQSAEYLLDIATKYHEVQIAKRATHVALRGKQYQIAMKAASLWITFVPTDLAAHKIMSSLLLMQGRVNESISHLELILNNFQDNPEQFKLFLERMLEQHKDSTFMADFLEKLQAKYPNNPAILLNYARFYMQNNQESQALNILHPLLISNPDDDEAVPLYAFLLNTMGQDDEAILWLGQSLAKYPNKSEWRIMYARMLTNAERFDEAITQFEILLTSGNQQQRNELLYTLGIVSLQNKNFSLANNYFFLLIETRYKMNAAYYYLGVIAQEQNKLQTALKWFYQVEDSSNYLNAQIQIALILAEQKKLDAAIQHLQNVPVSNVEEKINFIQLEAELLIDKNHYQKALKAYKYALSLKQDDTTILYMQALLYEKIGNVDLLEKNLRHILEIEPENVGALNALGYSLTQYTDRYQEAYKLIKKAFNLSSGDYYILDSMGWVLYKLGNHIEAIAYLRKAKVQRDDPEISAHLGVVLWKNGDKATALKVWKNARTLFPEDKILEKIVRNECQLDIESLF